MSAMTLIASGEMVSVALFGEYFMGGKTSQFCFFLFFFSVPFLAICKIWIKKVSADNNF